MASGSYFLSLFSDATAAGGSKDDDDDEGDNDDDDENAEQVDQGWQEGQEEGAVGGDLLGADLDDVAEVDDDDGDGNGNYDGDEEDKEDAEEDEYLAKFINKDQPVSLLQTGHREVGHGSSR